MLVPLKKEKTQRQLRKRAFQDRRRERIRMEGCKAIHQVYAPL